MGFSSVKSYLDSLDNIGKEKVLTFISFMDGNFPQYKLKISFSMPMWWKGEKMYQYKL